MTIKTALFSHLTTDAAITAIVGLSVYPTNAPASASLPYITFEVVSVDDLRHFSGIVGLAQTRMQIDSWDADGFGSSTLGEAVRAAMHGFRGPMGTEALFVNDVGLETQRDDFERPSGGGEVGLYRVSMDFFMWHDVVIPP